LFRQGKKKYQGVENKKKKEEEEDRFCSCLSEPTHTNIKKEFRGYSDIQTNDQSLMAHYK
jgi:hypothetical protein